MWLWRRDREGSDVDRSERWDVIWDLDGVWPVGGVKSNGVETLRMSGAGGEAVLTPIGR